MKCKFCSAPLPKRGAICGYCDQRNPLNLKALCKIEIEGKNKEHNCPVCKISFEDINIGLKERVLVQRCHGCDGVFITEDILENLIKREASERSKVDFKILQFIKNHPRHEKETVIRYRRCPICDNMMQRINYRAVSGVIVDRCLRHGIWLDGGELRQLFDWKEAGGSKKKDTKLPTDKKTKSMEYLHKDSLLEAYFDPLGDFFTWLQGG